MRRCTISPQVEQFLVNLSHRWSLQVLLLPVAFGIIAYRCRVVRRRAMVQSNEQLMRRTRVASRCSGVFFGLNLGVLGVSMLHIGCASVSARDMSCLSNVRQLSLGVLMYAEDYDEHLPVAAIWSEAITSKSVKGSAYLPASDKDPFRCPSAVSPAGYGLNAATGGIAMDKVDRPIDTVLLFEADCSNRSFSGGLSDMAGARHQSSSNVAWMDGHANRANEFVRTKLNWSPGVEASKQINP